LPQGGSEPGGLTGLDKREMRGMAKCHSTHGKNRKRETGKKKNGGPSWGMHQCSSISKGVKMRGGKRAFEER